MAKPTDRYPGWSAYWANPRKPDEPQRIDSIRLWVYDDPNWNWWTFDWGKDIDTVRAKLSPMIDATDPDLSAFRKHGGKLIMFMGWDDPVGAALRHHRLLRQARDARGLCAALHGAGHGPLRPRTRRHQLLDRDARFGAAGQRRQARHGRGPARVGREGRRRRTRSWRRTSTDRRPARARARSPSSVRSAPGRRSPAMSGPTDKAESFTCAATVGTGRFEKVTTPTRVGTSDADGTRV